MFLKPNGKSLVPVTDDHTFLPLDREEGVGARRRGCRKGGSCSPATSDWDLRRFHLLGFAQDKQSCPTPGTPQLEGRQHPAPRVDLFTWHVGGRGAEGTAALAADLSRPES